MRSEIFSGVRRQFFRLSTPPGRAYRVRRRKLMCASSTHAFLEIERTVS